jgi:SAM-dependent methyltransferase
MLVQAARALASSPTLRCFTCHPKELPRVLRQLHGALKPGGVLFSSNPHGENEEGWNRGRYGAYHSLEAWRCYMSDAGFTELEYYYRPVGLPRERQPWLASVWRRPKKTK